MVKFVVVVGFVVRTITTAERSERRQFVVGVEDDGGAHGRTMVMIQLHARKANSVKNMAMRNADTTACTILRHVHGCPGDIPVHSHSKQARADRLRVVVVVAAVVGSSAAACGDEVAVIAAAPSK